MLESTESLLPNQPASGHGRLNVVMAGFDENSLDELGQLLITLGVDPKIRIHCHAKKINPSTYIGKGKIDEIKLAIEKDEASAVILDVELSPNQLRNLEKEIGKPILDRPGVIIEIFSRHARTKESKTQVELARLQ